MEMAGDQLLFNISKQICSFIKFLKQCSIIEKQTKRDQGYERWLCRLKERGGVDRQEGVTEIYLLADIAMVDGSSKLDIRRFEWEIIGELEENNPCTSFIRRISWTLNIEHKITNFGFE